jgi:LDH2 family malate/lactate/ureidoglycolate dehydrogenase
VLLPGELEQDHMERQRRDGIDVDAAVLDKLRSLAERAG